MAKNKTVFVCSECGYTSPKWSGKCPECNEWNTMTEEEQKKANDVADKVFEEWRVIYESSNERAGTGTAAEI